MRNKMYFGVALTMLAMICAGAAQEPLREVTMSGEAVIEVVPDQVVVTFGVSSENHSLDKAVESVRASSGKLIAAIKEMKLADGDVTTSDLSISPETDYQDRKAGIVGYTVSRTYTARLRDVSMLATFLQVCLKSGANKIDGIDYQSSDDQKKRDEVRILAVRAAKAKATLLATELGAKVGKVTLIQDGYIRYSPYRTSINTATMAPRVGESADYLPAGRIELRASITVSFVLE